MQLSVSCQCIQWGWTFRWFLWVSHVWDAQTNTHDPVSTLEGLNDKWSHAALLHAGCRMQNAPIPFRCFSKSISICWHWDERSPGGNVLFSSAVWCLVAIERNVRQIEREPQWLQHEEPASAEMLPHVQVVSLIQPCCYQQLEVGLWCFQASPWVISASGKHDSSLVSLSGVPQKKHASMHSVSLNPTDSWQEVMLLSAANVPTAELFNKRGSRLWRRSTARPDGSNNGALFQICCLSHRRPFKLINAAVVPLKLNFNPHLMQPDV